MMGFKKCNFVFVIVLFFLGATSAILGGCQKDYDGQLEIIRNQIKSGVISLDNLYSKVILIEEQIEVLQEALSKAETSEQHKKDIQDVLGKLSETKEELKQSISGLEQKIEANDQGLLDLQTSLENAEERFNASLLELSTEIRRIDSSLDKLDGRVGKLEEQLESLREKQELIGASIEELKEAIAGLGSQEQIDALKEALETLEGLHASLSLQVADVEKALTIMKENIKANAGAIDKNTEDINGMATQISGLTGLVNNLVERIDNIVTSQNLVTKIDLKDAIDEISKKYSDELTTQLELLRTEYDDKLEELKKLIESGSSEELKKLIEEVQGQVATLNSTIEAHLKDYMATANLVTDLKKQVDALDKTVKEHTDKLSVIESSIEAIKSDIQKLFDRIQSIVIIPKYDGNYVKMESGDGNAYKLTMEVDIRPFDIAKEIIGKNKGAFSIVVKPLEQLPTRAAALPAFTIDAINVGTTTFTITASTKDITSVYRYSTAMDFQVALALNDVVGGDGSKNDKLSAFAGVYYVAPNSQDVDVEYSFYAGSELLNTKLTDSLSGFTDDKRYNLPILSDGKLDDKIYSIFNNQPLTAQRANVRDQIQSCDVICDLAFIYNSKDEGQADLANYIQVTADGHIMKKASLPGGETLDGVKLIIGLQAKKGSIYYGMRSYICVVLQNEPQN